MKAHLILVTGSRAVPRPQWIDIVYNALEPYKDEGHDYLVLMHGHCPHPGNQGDGWKASIDMLAHEWTEDNGIPVLPFPAKWEQGKSAGPKRNQLMVDTYRALTYNGLWTGEIVAFHPDLEHSAGTGGLVKFARSTHAQTVIHYDGQRVNVLRPIMNP